MKRDYIFSIEELCCQYIAGVPILNIRKVEIPFGKLIFVVGKSGVGKSTFIETLGFMNNTIAVNEKTRIRYHGRPDSSPEELKDFWKRSNDLQSLFRLDHFSFIFQQTNLMNNFTSGENMMVNLLINGESLDCAKQRILSVMDQLSLPKELFDRNISELSGGQRQRLAFARAVTAKFNVLFGDEPTGNLDQKTAAELMRGLKYILVEEHKTAIMVSHDLSLAIEFADIIIPITPVGNGEYRSQTGEILEKNILKKRNGQWESHLGTRLESVDRILQYHLN